MFYKRFSIFSEKNFFIFYFLIAFFKNFLFSNIKILYVGFKHGIRPYNKKIINLKKTSDTLFIMGGGETINEINKEQWKIIKNSDSLGINRWLYHVHVPTYMMIEGAKKKDMPFIKNAEDSVYDTWQKSDYRYKNTLFIIKDLDGLSINFNKIKSFQNRMYTMLKLIPPGKTTKGLGKSFNLINNISFLNNISFPLGSRGSITHATSFGVLAGYKNIVLCGIDLHGGYFWEKSKPEMLFSQIPEFQPVSKLTHATMVPNDSEVTVDNVLLNIAKSLDKNQRIFISSPNSLLAKYFPVYW